MSPLNDHEGLGTDELRTLLAEAIHELPITHPVRRLWERMDQILTDGSPECLPAPWDGDLEPGYGERDPEPASADVTPDRVTVQQLIAGLRNQADNLQVWVEAPDAPEGVVPLDGRIHLVDDADPTAGDPPRFVALGRASGT